MLSVQADLWSMLMSRTIRIYTTSFASVYPHYVAKAERKGRTKAEVDQIIAWLTGYGQKQLETQLENKTTLKPSLRKLRRSILREP